MKLECQRKGHKGRVGWLESCSRLSLMIIVSASQFHVYLLWSQCLFISVLNVKALVGAFNQEKALDYKPYEP